MSCERTQITTPPNWPISLKKLNSTYVTKPPTKAPTKNISVLKNRCPKKQTKSPRKISRLQSTLERVLAENKILLIHKLVTPAEKYITRSFAIIRRGSNITGIRNNWHIRRFAIVYTRNNNIN